MLTQGVLAGLGAGFEDMELARHRVTECEVTGGDATKRPPARAGTPCQW
jgi:hypothetical protein